MLFIYPTTSLSLSVQVPPAQFNIQFSGPSYFNNSVGSQINVTDNQDGTYTVYWVTTVAGQYRLDVSERFTGIPISGVADGSPWFPIVYPGPFSAANSNVTGKQSRMHT